MDKVKTAFTAVKGFYATNEKLIWEGKGVVDAYKLHKVRELPGQIHDLVRKPTPHNGARVAASAIGHTAVAFKAVSDGAKLLARAAPGLKATSLTGLKVHPIIRLFGKVASLFVSSNKLHKSRMLLKSLAKVKEDRGELDIWVTEHENDLVVALGQAKYDKILAAVSEGLLDTKEIIAKVKRDLREERWDSATSVVTTLIEMIALLVLMYFGQSYKHITEKIEYGSTAIGLAQMVFQYRRPELNFEDEKGKEVVIPAEEIINEFVVIKTADEIVDEFVLVKKEKPVQLILWPPPPDHEVVIRHYPKKRKKPVKIPEPRHKVFTPPPIEPKPCRPVSDFFKPTGVPVTA